MSTSRYSEIARSAALHENAGSLTQAAKLWRQANELTVKAARVRKGGAACVRPIPKRNARRVQCKLIFFVNYHY